MKQKILFFVGVIGFFAMVSSVWAQTPGQPGSLSVGMVTDNSIEWKFNLGGSMVSEVQLFVGDEAMPKMTMQVANYAMSIVETGLSSNMLYEKRRAKPVYYGTLGAFSDYFPSVRTLSKLTSPTFEPIIGSSNVMMRIKPEFGMGEGMTAWQLYDVNNKELRGWVVGGDLQYGPFVPGDLRVFRFRSRNADGIETEWTSQTSYALPTTAIVQMPPEPTLPPLVFVSSTARVNANVSALNVRAAASLSGRKIGRVKAGMTFAVLETKNGWHHIQYTPAISGWVFGQYVSIK